MRLDRAQDLNLGSFEPLAGRGVDCAILLVFGDFECLLDGQLASGRSRHNNSWDWILNGLYLRQLVSIAEKRLVIWDVDERENTWEAWEAVHVYIVSSTVDCCAPTSRSSGLL